MATPTSTELVLTAIVESLGIRTPKAAHLFGQSRAPTVNDDELDGFSVYSVWEFIDTDGPNWFVCTDPTAAAADWEAIE